LVKPISACKRKALKIPKKIILISLDFLSVFFIATYIKKNIVKDIFEIDSHPGTKAKKNIIDVKK
jgi:hypothetical protein